MIEMPYGFRIDGSCRDQRRVVDATLAFSAYATCDVKANINNEAYLSAFQFGKEFCDILNMSGSTKGYSGSSWSPWLWFDIDRQDDIDLATADSRQLTAFLLDRYHLDEDDLLIFFSGSKGYHVGLPTSLWQPQPSQKFHRIAKTFAECAAEKTGIKIDNGIYDRVRAFRAPNSRHPKSRLHKRRLYYKELLHLKTEAILSLASQPIPFDIPAPPCEIHQAASDWKAAIKRVDEQRNYHQQRKTVAGSIRLARQTLEFIRDGASKGHRHLWIFQAAANLAEFGCPPELAHALLTESGLDSGLTSSDVRRQINCGLNHATPDIVPQNTAGSTPEVKGNQSGSSNTKCDTNDSKAF